MATRDELEAAIDAAPDKPENYLVLGDFLQQQQDPYGELIALAAANNGRAAVLQRELGPPPPRYGSWTWKYGFVSYYRNIIDEDDEAVIAKLFDHRSMRHAMTLDLDLAGREYDDRQWLVNVIAKQPRPCWRSLTLNSYWRGGNDPPAGDLDVSALWAVLPRIQKLRITARTITPGALQSVTLEELALDGGVDAAELAPLFAGSAPYLRELELYDVDADRLGSIIEGAASAPPLTKLVVSSPRSRVVKSIQARYPMVTFVDKDRDRYEQTGE